MSQRLSFASAAPELYKHLSALDSHIAGHIDKQLFELVKLRASMLNGCAFCVDMHSADAMRAGEDPARLFGIAAWRDAPWYTPRERAALALTDAATRFGDHGVPDDVYAAALTEFGEEGITYLVAAIAMINTWNRFAITFQSTPRSAARVAAARQPG